MTSELLDVLHRRPSVHQLCYGLFIGEVSWLSEYLVAIPMKALGFNSQACYTAQYANEVAGAVVDQTAINNLIAQGSSALPIVSIVNLLDIDDDPEVLERQSETSFLHARRVLGWSSGDESIPFAMLTCTKKQSFFRLLLPHSRFRQHLNFLGHDFQRNELLKRIYEVAKSDEHFDFALSLLHEALREANPHFKIARLFNCLECLAYKLKRKHAGQTRRAVKELLGQVDGVRVAVQVDDERYEYDIIEIAGRLRDKLFHGAILRASDLNVETRKVFSLIEKNPEQIISTLLSYCEIEISRWANGTSNGLNVDE